MYRYENRRGGRVRNVAAAGVQCAVCGVQYVAATAVCSGAESIIVYAVQVANLGAPVCPHTQAVNQYNSPSLVLPMLLVVVVVVARYRLPRRTCVRHTAAVGRRRSWIRNDTSVCREKNRVAFSAGGGVTGGWAYSFQMRIKIGYGC